MKRRFITALLGVVFAIVPSLAQKLDPIVWETTVESNDASGALIKLSATIEKGWHLYGLDLP